MYSNMVSQYPGGPVEVLWQSNEKKKAVSEIHNHHTITEEVRRELMHSKCRFYFDMLDYNIAQHLTIII